jgi:predicted transcriptional regulator
MVYQNISNENLVELSKTIVLPQSAQKIFKILRKEGPLTSGGIEARSKYSDRTVRNALKKLVSIGIVKKSINFNDMRTSLYHVIKASVA